MYRFEFAESCKGLLFKFGCFAVLGAGGWNRSVYCGFTHYYSNMCRRLQFEVNNTNGGNCAFGLSFAAWFYQTYLPIRSHGAAFTVLKNIRTALTKKLSRVPMGFVLDTPSGKFKTMLVDTVEKLSYLFAHIDTGIDSKYYDSCLNVDLFHVP